MTNLEIKVKLPFLWGKAVFRKNKWSQINLIVGPNGSGKTLLAQSISEQLENANYSVRFLKSDRNNISSTSKEDISKEDFYSSTLMALKEDLSIKTKVELVLSNMFGKSIMFAEEIDGSFIPVVKNKAWNVEYDLTQVECHGLKEIITLLVNLYNNKYDCLIFDEPELHLHPQFQQFFMNEIRKESRLHPKKIFFLITHSPFFIDLRFPEDLTGVIACHINKEPSHIEKLSKEDYELFRRFLPRFNTYHKQFFFSDNQIFVEGYTDQQMFTQLLPFISDGYKSAGTGVIDVGGKDELGVFCKVCHLLGTNSRIITDLDSLFSGKLRDVINQDPRVIQWLSKQEDKQLEFYKKVFTPKELSKEYRHFNITKQNKNNLNEKNQIKQEILSVTLESLILKLEKLLIVIGWDLKSKKRNLPKKFKPFSEKLNILINKYQAVENIDTYKTVLLQGIYIYEKELLNLLPQNLAKTIPQIKSLTSIILAAAEAARVYILPEGCIEHYYICSDVKFMPVSSKDKLFHKELEHILHSDKKNIRREYSKLLSILEEACSGN